MQLRDYQQDIADRGTSILRSHGIVYLAMEVRTGKTLTALAIARQYGATRPLFVTKKKAIPDITAQAASIGIACHVTNYEQLPNTPDTFDLVIADEAHTLGAFPSPSLRTKELRRIVGNKPLILMSGTPTPESWAQIYHQLWPSLNSPFSAWPTFYKWAREFVNVKQRKINGLPFNDYSDADRAKIEERTRHLIITFSQADAGFEMPVIEHTHTVDMKATTMQLADRLRIDRVYTGRNGHTIEADTNVKLMQKTHQIHSGTVITDTGTLAFDDSKARYIADTFAGKKIAIFYKFTGELTHITNTFGNRVTTCPATFRDNDDLVFVSQIVSGREGINLATADAIVMYNIDFSAVSYWQARARLQTLDRDKPAEVHWVFSRGGIETKIYEAVQGKKDYTINYFNRDFLTPKKDLVKC